MSYLRIKWIKGHPYLYEQASYREGGKVKTKHIRYVGKDGYAGSGGSRGGTSGFTPPPSLTPERQSYVDKEMNRLKLRDKFPFACDILRQYLYHQDYKLRFNSRKKKMVGYVESSRNGSAQTVQVLELGLRSDSDAFTWLHEMGHSLEHADGLVDNELTKLRSAFVIEVYRRYKTAIGELHQQQISEAENIIHEYGALIDIRQSDIPSETKESLRLLGELAKVKSSALETNQFWRMFDRWAYASYRFTPQEIFADSVASLILDPQKAFDAHGVQGRKYLTRVWIKLVKHFEDTYHLSLHRPRRSKHQAVS